MPPIFYERWGSASYHERTIREIPRRPYGKGRRRCHCGCGGWKTHAGCANGLAMTAGCELSVRRWVREQDQVKRARLVLTDDPMSTARSE